MKRYLVIGDPIAHSLSPVMHRAAFVASGIEATYEPVRVAAERLAAALAEWWEEGVDGINVTLPHKEALITLCAEVDEVARRIGAVNTLWRGDRGWRGTNTDAEGFVRSLPVLPTDSALGREQAGSKQAGSKQAGSERAGSERAGSEQAGSEQAGSEQAGSEQADSGRDEAGRKQAFGTLTTAVGRSGGLSGRSGPNSRSGLDALVLGAGGAARAVIVGLRAAGAEVAVSARRRDAADALRPLGASVVPWGSPLDASLVVNATSASLHGGDAFAQSLPFSDHLGQTFVDLVYIPRETPFLRRARKHGAFTVDGSGMLLHQGAIAFERWHGIVAPIDAMRCALDEALDRPISGSSLP